MDIKKLINDFESLTLLNSEWTHVAHLRVALWYIYHEESFYQAVQKIRCGLIRYGTTKPISLCYERYHETITTFWAYQLRELLMENRGKSFEELESLVTKNDKVFNKGYILKFYPKEIFNSQKARSISVSPTNLRYLFWGYSKPTLKPALAWLFILFISSSGLLLQYLGHGFSYIIAY